ncbi:polycomb group protein Pc-like [Senna tora]|uniref:Polycomb group protein Pc-like n=1 Tax=Senna tora TaxID=362788 RepID=A0A834SP83_9FABA|nr:polycomb group protein Pc-like [Senna tora]
MTSCCAQITQNVHPIAATVSVNHDPQWSGKKMEGDEGFNTVECLRGRLLAERQASRVAKQEAESMDYKLVELEKRLRYEIKLRERAERKLRKLKNKLESLRNSCSSEKSEISCSSASRDSEASETKPPTTTNPSVSENTMHNDSEPPTPIARDYDSRATHNSNSDCSFSQDPNPLDLNHDESSSSSSKSSSKDSNSEDLKNDESRQSSLSSKTSVTEYEEEDDDDRNFIDISLAIVPVKFAETRNVKAVNESVIEALEALRHAREKLVCSIGARHTIKVGPT